MKINKKTQYGLLLVLYLCRSGRSTLETISLNLGLSKSFLEQVARDLRLYEVVRSIRGPNGGYEVLGEPTVKDVWMALGDSDLISSFDRYEYKTGKTEHRALLSCIIGFQAALIPLFNQKVVNVGKELVRAELSKLREAEGRAN